MHQTLEPTTHSATSGFMSDVSSMSSFAFDSNIENSDASLVSSMSETDFNLEIYGSSNSAASKPAPKRRAEKQRHSKWMATESDRALQSSWWEWVLHEMSQRAKTHRKVLIGGRPKEYFGGHGEWTTQVAAMGFLPWPMLEILDTRGQVRVEGDLARREVVERELHLIDNGGVSEGHFGTPCTTMSLLFQNSGPGTRTDKCPEGTDIDVREIGGNILAMVTCLLCCSIFFRGGNFSIENPSRSWLFRLRCCRYLSECLQHNYFSVTFDQCCYGLAPPDAPEKRYRKTTTVVSSKDMSCLRKKCRNGSGCGAQHMAIQGTVKIDGSVFQRAKLAGRYPPALASALAHALLSS